MEEVKDVIIIGAGASGLAAAGSAAAFSKKVLVLDGNEKIGKKLYITGKGRCNVTNDCEPREFLNNVVNGRKFLTGCIYRFPPSYVMALLEELGLPLKTERGGRVFPESDRSSDVIRALGKYATRSGAEIRLDSRVSSVKKQDGKFYVCAGGQTFVSENAVIACGGKSYPSTGSTGDGYKFAKAFGHSIVPPVPALVPIRLKTDVSEIEGLGLKNVKITVSGEGFKESGFGEAVFTHDGISGPVPLTLSSLINRKKIRGGVLSIDLKPALSESVLDKRILSDFGKYANKQLKNALFDLLPRSLIPFAIRHCGLNGEKSVNEITKEERRVLLSALKGMSFEIDGLYGTEYGIVTSGGADLKEIDPSTFESKIISGLYIVGETLDADALTGGFNIQIALSSGFAAGEAIGGKHD